MAVTTLGAKSVGSTVTIQENTGPMSYYVSANNYNAGISTNPSGYRLVVRSIPFKVNAITFSNGWKWDGVSAYQNCLSFYENTLTDSVKAGIPEISYYAPNANKSQQHSRDNYTYGLFSTKVFALNYWHINNLPIYPRYGNMDIEPTTYQTNQTSMPSNLGSIATTILQNFYPSNGSSTGWIYLPNMYKNVTINSPSGTIGTQGYVTSWSRDSANKGLLFTRTAVENPGVDYYILIGFCLPDETKVNDDGTLYQGPLPPSGFVNFPLLAMQQNTVQISWTESSGATSYTLQRSTNNGSSWETAYTGPNTSYTDTIGTWDTVMYQVSASNADGSSPYTQSASIHLVASSNLVISGQDGELGALTGDVSFQVLSNTGNQIDLSVAINGFTFYTAQVDSGYNHKISIYDIPTGSGQIVASASVQSSAGVVNQTRTWQYIKQSLQFVDDAGMGVLEQNGENIYPLTVQEAVKTYSFWGNTLDKAMMRLSSATFYNQTPSPIYQEYDLDLSTVQVGDIIQLPVNGRMVQHTIVHIGNPNASIYDTSCDGVWVLSNEAPVAAPVFPRETAYPSSGLGWGTAEVRATYESIKTTYASEVQTAMKTVLLPYDYNMPNTAGETPVFNIATLSNGQSSTVFPLSAIEYGLSASTYPELATASNVLDYFANQGSRIISSGARYATRDMEKTILTSVEAGRVCRVVNGNTGGFQTLSTNASVYHRPAFILPTTFSHTYYIDNQNMVHEAQEYSPVGALYDFMYNKIPFTKYASGTYTGTGTYGAGSPMSLTFPTKPLFIMISAVGTSSSNGQAGMLNCNILTNSFSQYRMWALTSSAISSSYNYSMLNGTTISWYGTNTNYQLNISGQTYNWIAFLE